MAADCGAAVVLAARSGGTLREATGGIAASALYAGYRAVRERCVERAVRGEYPLCDGYESRSHER
jgi:hypothetical protein